MEKHILSKSTFIKGYHCLKSLYLHKKRPFLRDRITAEQRAKFKRGHEVGDLAQDLYPGGIDVSPKSPSQYQKSVLKTQELIESGTEIIYEATFQFEKVLVMLDILVKKEGKWYAYEVKSSKKLSETYYTDAALQNWVISNSGLDLESFSLVYVDENYRLNGELDLQQYFISYDVTEQVKEKFDFITEKVNEEKGMLEQKHSPKIVVGDQCFAPYKCDFVGFCWKKIEDKPYIPKSIELEKKSNNKIEGNAFLSFISHEQAIPKCENQKAYSSQILGFQINDAESIIAGKDCLNRKQIAEQLFRATENYSQICVFDKSLLIQYLEELQQIHPEFTEKANVLSEKSFGLIDLMIKEQKIEQSDKSIYTAAWFSKTYFGKECKLHKLPVYSDILAQELYFKNKKGELLIDDVDTENLKDYLAELNILTRLFLGIVLG